MIKYNMIFVNDGLTLRPNPANVQDNKKCIIYCVQEPIELFRYGKIESHFVLTLNKTFWLLDGTDLMSYLMIVWTYMVSTIEYIQLKETYIWTIGLGIVSNMDYYHSRNSLKSPM